MDIIIAIAYLQLLIFAGYVGYVYHRYGVLKSISHSTYVLRGNSRLLFAGFCWGLGFTLLAQQDLWGWYGIASFVGLAYTGSTMDHDGDRVSTSRVHDAGAYAAVLVLYAHMMVSGVYTIPTVVMAGCLLVLPFYSRIWWWEILAFAGIICYVIS